MKGYKAFDKGWVCRDFQYKLGETYELPKEQKLKICECGFHFCENPIDVFGYYYDTDDVLIAEVEALGEIQNQGTKYCTDKIRIVREFTKEDLQDLILIPDGRDNIGIKNSGSDNIGDYNSGNYNSGNHNSGSFNSGHCNRGRHNSGNSNSGNFNTGSCNSGSCNSGNYNSGNYNSGDYNSGRYNSGAYNSGCHNSGIFNTDEPEMRAFNKLTGMTFSQFCRSINYDFFDLCCKIQDGDLNEEDKKHIKALPNFDTEIFKEITGIDLANSDDPATKE